MVLVQKYRPIDFLIDVLDEVDDRVTSIGRRLQGRVDKSRTNLELYKTIAQIATPELARLAKDIVLPEKYKD